MKFSRRKRFRIISALSPPSHPVSKASLRHGACARSETAISTWCLSSKVRRARYAFKQASALCAPCRRKLAVAVVAILFRTCRPASANAACRTLCACRLSSRSRDGAYGDGISFAAHHFAQKAWSKAYDALPPPGISASFLRFTLYHTSNLHLAAETKKRQLAYTQAMRRCVKSAKILSSTNLISTHR